MDFKIGDDFNENGPIKHELLDNKKKIYVIIGGAFLIGLIIMVILLLVLNKKDNNSVFDNNVKTTLSIDDKSVVASYKMVTYGYNEGRNGKFLMGVGLDVNSFNNQEKYYYALQYCVKKDLTKSSETDGAGHYIYTLPKNYMDIYMERVFGKDVEYDTSSSIENTFKFDIDGCNTGTLTYDSATDMFKVLLTGNNTLSETQDNTYYRLDKAYGYSDGKLILEEKVIYTKTEENNGKKSLVLFSDKNNYDTLGTITEIVTESNGASIEYTKEEADYYAHLPLSFDFDEYKDKAGTIIYTFKYSDLGYYFVNSEVK